MCLSHIIQNHSHYQLGCFLMMCVTSNVQCHSPVRIHNSFKESETPQCFKWQIQVSPPFFWFTEVFSSYRHSPSSQDYLWDIPVLFQMTAPSFLLVSEECRAWKRTFLSSFENHLRVRFNKLPSASLTYFGVLTAGLESPLDFKHFILSQVNLCCWSCFYCATYIFSMLSPTSAFILMTACILELKM